MCSEKAWGTTNHVPKIIEGRLYAPLPVIAAAFQGLKLSYVPGEASLLVTLLSEGQSDEFAVPVPARPQRHQTLTRARIFPYRASDMPQCTTARISRPAYTLTLTASKDYNAIRLSLQSKSGTILILWDESSLRLPTGSSSGVMHEGVRFIDRQAPQAPTPVAPGATHTDVMVAKSTVWYGEYTKEWYYSLFYIKTKYDEERNSIFVLGTSQSVSGSLALLINGRKVYESFQVACTVKPGEYRF